MKRINSTKIIFTIISLKQGSGICGRRLVGSSDSLLFSSLACASSSFRSRFSFSSAVSSFLGFFFFSFLPFGFFGDDDGLDADDDDELFFPFEVFFLLPFFFLAFFLSFFFSLRVDMLTVDFHSIAMYNNIRVHT